MKEYEKTGVLSIEDLRPPSEEQLKKGVAVIECVQNIPCNPCVDACPVKAISMRNINDIPVIDYDKCTGCGNCVAVCPGLAIFLVKTKDDTVFISIPYEFLPIPNVGDRVEMLDRRGEKKGKAEVVRVRKAGKTAIVTIKTEKRFAMVVRNIRVKDA